jgi:hypothetical protein
LAALPVPPARIWPWSAGKAKFFREVWTLGSKGVAEKYDCDNTIIYEKARAMGLPATPRSFKKGKPIPQEILDFIVKLEAEEAQVEATSKPATDAPTLDESGSQSSPAPAAPVEPPGTDPGTGSKPINPS